MIGSVTEISFPKAKSNRQEVVRSDFAEWFKQAWERRRCVIFRDPSYNARSGGLQTIEIRLALRA